jgi:citronellol/citronellal dehydrogenase
MKRFDLMHQVNVRGTFATTQACHPHLAASGNAHVLVALAAAEPRAAMVC